jgi:glycosyltransferase involved in cell wall biosynthesis
MSEAPVQVTMVDPSAFTPPYDHALCAALARLGCRVELVTSTFLYGEVPEPVGYSLTPSFYRRALGAPGSRLRQASKLADHVPGMLDLRRRLRGQPGVVHFQWLDVQWLDHWLLPRPPVVLTAHDLLPREPRPGQAGAQRRLYERVDAVIVHTEYGRGQLVERLGLPPSKVHVIPHGAFAHLTQIAPGPLPPALAGVEGPVVLFFGLLRPYKGLDTLLEAWEGVGDAELWIVGRPRMDISALRSRAGKGVRFVDRFVSEAELPAFFRRADVVALPYARTERLDFSGVLASALAFGKPIVLSDVGGLGEVAGRGAARLVAAEDSEALRVALQELVADPEAREQLAVRARAAAAGAYSWERAAERTLEVYRSLG